MFSIEPSTELTLEVKGFAPCDCGCEEVAIFPTPGGVHCAKALCVNCGKHRTWVPYPDRDDRIQRQLADVEKALQSGWGSSWEFTFLESIQEQLERRKSLSPKQLSRLDEALNYLIPKAEREWLP